MTDNNETANKKERAVSPTSAPLLGIFEEMLHNRTTEKKRDTQNNPEHSGHQKIIDADRFRHCDG